MSEDYRATILYKNATAAMQSIDATDRRVDELHELRAKDQGRILMLEQEIRTLTQRFNMLFISLQGTGATSGDLD